MLAVANYNFNRYFENVEPKILLDTEQQYIAQIDVAPGQCFEATQEEGREETVTLIKGVGVLDIGETSEEISDTYLVKLGAQKAVKIFNRSKETLQLCFVSTPSSNASKDIYTRNKEGCSEYEAGNKERIYEFFGKYNNGPCVSHSIALIEIDEGGGSSAHVHPVVEESYVMIEGDAKLIVGDKVLYPKAGEAVAIPVGVLHQITNIGKEALRFIAVVTPPWTQDCGIYER